eukprot:scaffold34169_cov17-Tisochrysis_lutea.AAC.1
MHNCAPSSLLRRTTESTRGKLVGSAKGSPSRMCVNGVFLECLHISAVLAVLLFKRPSLRAPSNKGATLTE